MAVFIVLWSCLFTTKLRSVIRHNLGHSNIHTNKGPFMPDYLDFIQIKLKENTIFTPYKELWYIIYEWLGLNIRLPKNCQSLKLCKFVAEPIKPRIFLKIRWWFHNSKNKSEHRLITSWYINSSKLAVLRAAIIWEHCSQIMAALKYWQS